MAYPEDFPRQADPHPEPKPVPRRVAEEETEMLKNDPAERAVSGIGMDEIAESGDRDPLLGSAVNGGDANEGAGTREETP